MIKIKLGLSAADFLAGFKGLHCASIQTETPEEKEALDAISQFTPKDVMPKHIKPIPESGDDVYLSDGRKVMYLCKYPRSNDHVLVIETGRHVVVARNQFSINKE